MMTPADYDTLFTPDPFSNVNLKIHDVFGRDIATLVNGMLTAGAYQFPFDGRTLASGIYYYRLSSGNFIEVKKMLLLM